jgi:DNA-binding transcriptional LysR family regulator
MDLAALKIFLAVAHERSFSRAAAKVHRTQPAVSQAVRRLELELGEQLFDRSSKTGTLTEAGRMLQNYGQRLVRLAEETESAVRELRDLRRGRVLIGANEAGGAHAATADRPASGSATRRSRLMSVVSLPGRSPLKCSRAVSISAR